jgi:hypothetical protein
LHTRIFPRCSPCGAEFDLGNCVFYRRGDGHLFYTESKIIGALPRKGRLNTSFGDSPAYVAGGQATISNNSISFIPGYSVLTEDGGYVRVIKSKISNSGTSSVLSLSENTATVLDSIVVGTSRTKPLEIDGY